MPVIVALAVGAAPVTWTVCGLRLLAKRGAVAAERSLPVVGAVEAVDAVCGDDAPGLVPVAA